MKRVMVRRIGTIFVLSLCLTGTAFAPSALAQAPPPVGPRIPGPPAHRGMPGTITPPGQKLNPPLPPPLVTGTAVATDQADYAPGASAHIRGQVFQAGETVRLQVLHADGTPSVGQDHLPWTVVADPDGGFHATWHVCEDDCVGSALRLTAVGVTSGKTAQALFSDAPAAPTFQLLKSFGSPSPGAYPYGGLMKGADGALYGTASGGGTSGFG
ncbi:MAG TPA: hypothetical protein VGQ67_16460, partial [Candidatus Polarisedimenticolia bacterium]|nr:hypothetical protein [Candidatus Polarisedimenticolia bacterium]